MSRTKLFVGISLTTLATLMLELTLTRLFSATMYYHFAFMAISLALFGSGASGVFIYVSRRIFSPERVARHLAMFSLLFGLSSLLALYVILSNPLTLDPGNDNYYRLAYIYVATAVPFFFSGCTVTLAITRFSHEITRLYLFDLMGAAAGCLLLIPFLNTMGAINTVLAVALISALATFTFATSAGRYDAAAAGLICLGLVALVAYNCVTGRIDIHRSKGKEETQVLFSKWNSFSRITVTGDLATGAEIQIDADAATGIVSNAPDLAAHEFQQNAIGALAYRLKHGADVLIIGPGGGSDVMAALVSGERNITAVEVNPIIARDVMSRDPFRSFSGGIYEQPGVKLAVDEGRSFIRSSPAKYDIIQATMVDTWAATTAGAFALTENNLYTVEAFEDYAGHLNDDGILTMTRWYFEPPAQLLRLVAITRKMMSDLGISDPSRHIMIVRDASTGDDRTPATFLFKKSPFTDDEIANIQSLARTVGFQLLYSPSDPPDNIFTRVIQSPDPARIWDSLDENVAPTSDNNPFFFNSIRMSRLASAFHGVEEWHKTNLGTVILLALLIITSIMVFIFILGPLALARGETFATDKAAKLRYLSYFAFLGAGFIIIEVAMIQKFILFLGHPVYSLTVVLFSLLTFSGLGSFLSGRFDDKQLPNTLVRIVGLLVGVVLLYIVLLSPIFYGLVQLPRPFRIIIAVALMAPLAILMGMPMPTGIRILRQQAPEIIPWAWGINGAASVTGSVGALVIALVTGFNQALIVGAVFYVSAAFIMSRTRMATGVLSLETGVVSPTSEPVDSITSV
jgi:predicted membrane-bound spermidine synthase